jgi:SSS family solute:Na+ symporter
MQFSTLDYTVFGVYIAAMVGVGIWFALTQKMNDSKDYFMASKSLAWWAIGGSLIASNISAEQMIGMAGSGFELGLGIAAYEIMAAVTLILVAKFFLPVFLKEEIYTMPQFVEKRYDSRVRTGLAIFWLLMFVLVNITSLFYLGGLAMETILGIPMWYGIIGLALYSATFSIFGGLRVVVWTDVIQVVVLIIGGLLASYAVLTAVGGGGIFEGIAELFRKAPEKFDMYFVKGDTYIDTASGETRSAYELLPGFGVLFTGMWIANFYYWGINQYIIQRALAAKSIGEAQKGMVFAAGMKMIMPFIVVLPGIAAFVLGADLMKADQAYPWVISNYVGTGVKGIVLAALVAAIGSSISSMVNSISTIYTLDIHKMFIDKDASEKKLIKIGQFAGIAAMIIGIMMTPMLENFGQIFQFIQEYTGFISPGILAIYVFGLFWKKTTTRAALAAIIIAIPLSLGLKAFFPELAFLHRMGLSFVVISAVMIVLSLMEVKDKEDDHALHYEKSLFKTSPLFNICSLIILGIVAAIYLLLG